ncbi:MAG: O-antigen ligase family protein [Caldilineaceae bacterium]|nr:O-antigen ligase family protein [Caldilineaceae bacterium]
MNPPRLPALTERFLLPALVLLLAACWIFGGDSVRDTSAYPWLSLLALPVLVFAVVALALDEAKKPLAVRLCLVVALLVALVPALQLLPVSMALWDRVPARHALAADLSIAGVTVLPHWSLDPAATERALWTLLPPLALCLGALALPSWQRLRLIQAIVALVLCNVLFAFFQVGLPQDSELRFYDTFDAGFGGFLANTNHQGTACIIGMVLSIGLGAEARLRAARGQARPHLLWWYFGLAGAFLLLVPLSTSRAAMGIALPILTLALLLTRTLRLRRVVRSRRMAVLALSAVVLAAVGVHALLGWMAVDRLEELRHTMAAAAVTIGHQHAPLGAGVGSFVPAFQQGAPESLLLGNYINHAHNEYAQWWLEAGWLGMSVLTIVLVLLVWAGIQIARHNGRRATLAGASLAALAALLAHSWADYPLRTLTLMTVAGALAGLLFAALGEAMQQPRQKRRNGELPSSSREPLLPHP